VLGTLITVLGMNWHSAFVTGIGTFTVFGGILGLVNLWIGVPGTRWFQDVFLPELEARYERFLRYALAPAPPAHLLLRHLRACSSW
jgi:hypothetical protein